MSMANFVANTQFSIESVNLGFYLNNLVSVELDEDSNVNFFGITYPDHYYVIADDGTENLRLDIYGQNLAVSIFGTLTAGTINAVGEYDINASVQRWYATGFSANAATTSNAATSASTSDDIAVIQNALSGGDTIVLSPFADTMGGYGGDDSIKGGGGDDVLDGGSGSDTAVFDAAFADATISFEGDVLVITIPTEGTDRLSNFEFVDFNDDVRSVASLLPSNDPPVPVAATATATEDGALVTAQLQASDPNGDPLSFSLLGGTAGLTIGGNGSYSFNPAADAYQSLKQGESQQVVAVYSVTDGRASATATLIITVTGVNDAPTFALSQQGLTTQSGVPVSFVSGATDIDGDTLTYTVSTAAHGTIATDGPGSFQYAPTAGFSGTDTFTITAADGKGGTATQTISVVIAAPNSDPVIANSGLQISTQPGVAKTFVVSASDPDGDTLTFSAADPAHGSIALGTGSQLIYTPDAGYTGTDSVIVTVSDGRGGSAMQTYTVTITAANSAPVIAETGLTFSTTLGTAKSFNVSASDADGDTLTFSAADPAHGSITGGSGGQFTYTPDTGFVGTDSFEVTVSDGNGGADVASFSATVLSGEVPTQRLFVVTSSSGFIGTFGGYGRVFGTTGSEEITVLDRPGAITFDPSFNKGGDVIRLAGDAADWQISRIGSTSILSDGDTFLEIPTGSSSLILEFDDGSRILRIDTQASTLKIGSQAFNQVAVQITAPAEVVSMPTGLDPDAFANIVTQPGGEVTAGGTLLIFGTTSAESVDLLFGDVTFDPSFNKGGDHIFLNAPAESFEAFVVGSGLRLSSEGLEISLPAGIVGTEIEFGPGDTRILRIDTGLQAIVLGDQQLAVDPIVLAAAL